MKKERKKGLRDKWINESKDKIAIRKTIVYSLDKEKKDVSYSVEYNGIAIGARLFFGPGKRYQFPNEFMDFRPQIKTWNHARELANKFILYIGDVQETTMAGSSPYL